MKTKMKLKRLHVQSFITRMEDQSANKLQGGGGTRDPVPTIATLPVKDCQPIPTTRFFIGYSVNC